MSLRSFQLRPGEELRPGLVRIVARIAKQAAALPGFRAGKAEGAVHQARLLVKLLRALVWTARPALGGSAGGRIRLQLRAAAGCLAETREASVLTATLSKLARKVSLHRQRAGYAQAATALAGSFAAPGDAAVRRRLAAAGRHLGRAALLFRRGAAKTVPPWPDAAQRQRAAARSCRRAMQRALASGRAGDFHEWRKKAKRLLLQLRVVEINQDGSMRKTIALVDQLQSKLGDHHDLAVLEGNLGKNSVRSNRPGPARDVLRHIRRQRSALEKQLTPLGRRCRRACAERLER